jgi:hypothetical protein
LNELIRHLGGKLDGLVLDRETTDCNVVCTDDA